MGSGMSVWVPAISAGAGILGALGSQWLSHIFISLREKQASEDRLQRERYFIATELVFMLERFAQNCVPAACESGYYDQNSGYIRVSHDLPNIDYTAITGDWRSLPPELMYRLTQIPVLQEEGRKAIGSAFDNDMPWDGGDGLHEINSQSCRLGLRAIRLSRELRKLCGMPDSELTAHPWSAWRVLSTVRARIIFADLHHARKEHKFRLALRQQGSPAPPKSDNAGAIS